MIKIKTIADAAIGDFIDLNGKIFTISSIESKGEYYVLGLNEGERIIILKEQKIRILQVK